MQIFNGMQKNVDIEPESLPAQSCAGDMYGWINSRIPIQHNLCPNESLKNLNTPLLF